MVYRITFFYFAIVDIPHHILVLVRIQFLAKLDLVDFLAFKELFTRDASKVKHLHKVHHIVGAQHRI